MALKIFLKRNAVNVTRVIVAFMVLVLSANNLFQVSHAINYGRNKQ